MEKTYGIIKPLTIEQLSALSPIVGYRADWKTKTTTANIIHKIGCVFTETTDF